MSLTEKLIEYPLNRKSFIQGWYIPKYICDEIIGYMNQNNKSYRKGNTSTGFNVKVKDSKDLYINRNDSSKTFFNYMSLFTKMFGRIRKKISNVKRCF